MAMSAMAQTDYTSKIANPGFEDGLSGWTNDGYQTQTNDAPTSEGWTKSGNAYAEKWCAATGSLDDASLTQTVTGLPNGYYVLRAEAHAVLQGSATTTIYGVTLNANRRQTKVQAGGTYKAGVVVSDGTLTIGISNTGTNANWVAVDNFRIEQVDTSLVAYKIYLYTVRSAAENLRKECKSNGYYVTEALQTAISQALSGRDREGVVEAIARLETAMGEYDKLLPACRTLRSLISSARNNALYTNYEGRDKLRSAISDACRVLASEGDVAKVNAGVAALQSAMDKYLANRPSEWVTVKNGNLWRTASGATVQAHAPGFVRVGDVWYMVGEDRANTWNPDVNLYSSTDLVHWRFEKKIIENKVTDSRLGGSRMIERAKLMYNTRTGKYIVWCHWDASDYSASEAACFSCDSVNGAYQLEWCGRLRGVKSRDCNVFVDNDGTAYFISTTEENRHLGLFRLSDDYLKLVEHTQLFAWQSREAPAIVRVGGTYFMFNSACSGWAPNQCKLAHTSNLKSGWSSLQNVGNSIAYDTQAAAILEIKGTKKTTYLYVGDRWQDPDLPNTKTIMFPIEFNGTDCTFKYHERFDINFVTGEWRETPTEGVFADKTGWKVIDVSSQETSSEYAPATCAIDGNVGTKWHTQYSGTAATAPHYIAIDMGRERVIKGFLATPRMDGSTNGLIRKYEFQVSDDGQEWTTVSSGSWLLYCTETDFASRKCRYIRLVCLEGEFASLAELDVVIGKDVETGVEEVAVAGAGKGKPVNRAFFTIDGMQIAKPVRGLFIERVVYADGTSRCVKRVAGSPFK